MHASDDHIARRSQAIDRATVLTIMMIFLALPIAAWIQHLYSSAMAGRWFLMVSGALAFPIGVFNGIGIWLGLWV